MSRIIEGLFKESGNSAAFRAELTYTIKPGKTSGQFLSSAEIFHSKYSSFTKAS